MTKNLIKCLVLFSSVMTMNLYMNDFSNLHADEKFDLIIFKFILSMRSCAKVVQCNSKPSTNSLFNLKIHEFGLNYLQIIFHNFLPECGQSYITDNFQNETDRKPHQITSQRNTPKIETI